MVLDMSSAYSFKHDNYIDIQKIGILLARSYINNRDYLAALELVDSKIEPGFLSIAGGNTNTTVEGVRTQVPYGYNHPMANSLMLLSNHWAAGADTYFVKATTKIKKTILYALCSYTDHDNTVVGYDAYELNVIAKQLLTDNLSACVKLGYGETSAKKGGIDAHATDARLFITYNF